MIAVEGIARSWGAFSLAASLRVERGEYMVVLGPSGCGKSLLLGTNAGIFDPERGAIRIRDRDVTRVPPEARGLGFVFQRSDGMPHVVVVARKWI